jgi:BMFP domain-containing protein YqiC
LSNNSFESIAAKVSAILHEKGFPSLQNPIAQLIRQGLQEMEFVSLDDFEVQQEVLNRLRKQLQTLESRVADLEKKIGPTG